MRNFQLDFGFVEKLAVRLFPRIRNESDMIHPFLELQGPMLAVVLEDMSGAGCVDRVFGRVCIHGMLKTSAELVTVPIEESSPPVMRTFPLDRSVAVSRRL